VFGLWLVALTEHPGTIEPPDDHVDFPRTPPASGDADDSGRLAEKFA
jgi:hypothetical protein